eukprot:jgi/Galph1/1009/GphlegSOOS_G5787.1
MAAYKLRTNVLQMMEKGIFRKSKWYEVVKRHPPLARPPNRGTPPKIVLEEDVLYEELLDKIPQLKYTPLSLVDSTTGFRNACDKFVYLQKLYMDTKGLSKEDAFEAVQKELTTELQDALRQSSSLYWNGTLGDSTNPTELVCETSYRYMKMEERMANLPAEQLNMSLPSTNPDWDDTSVASIESQTQDSKPNPH